MKKEKIATERHHSQSTDDVGPPTDTEMSEEVSNAHIAQQFDESAFYTLTEEAETAEE